MTNAEKKYQSLTTEEKIAANIRKIKPLFREVDKDRLVFVDRLIDQFATTIVLLERLVEVLNTDSILEDFSQGSQKFKRENPALKSYNATIKSFATLSKSLLDFLPERTQKQTGEALMNFAIKPPGVVQR